MVSRKSIWFLCVMWVGCTAGCQSLPDLSLAGLFGESVTESERDRHRQAFQETRSPEHLNWLLANCVETGMSPADVSRILGEDGTRLHGDGWVKNKSSQYLVDDETWKWDADRDGRSLLLVFREGRLVNFDPSEFAAKSFAEPAQEDLD